MLLECYARIIIYIHTYIYSSIFVSNILYFITFIPDNFLNFITFIKCYTFIVNIGFINRYTLLQKRDFERVENSCENIFARA